MFNSSEIQAVIFDLDGTLIDSLGDLADSMNLTLEFYGFPTHPENAYRHFVGDGVVNLVRRALPSGHHPDGFVMEATEKMRAIYADRWTHRTAPYPGIAELLTALNQHNIPLAILSNKPDGPTREITTLLLGNWNFTIVQGALPDVPIKPDPTAAIDIAKRLGVKPEHILYLGDTDTDMKTAHQAGFIPVGVTWGFRDEEELRAAGADHIIHAPMELLN